MKKTSVQGVILQSKVFFEKDKRLDIFTKELGRVSILVKRAFQKNGWGGRLDTLNIVQLELSKGKSFYYCNSCDLLVSFPHLRTDYARLNTALHFCDVVRKSSAFEQSNVEMYDLLVSGLQLLNTGGSVEGCREQFHTRFLENEGLLELGQATINEKEFGRAFEEYTGRKLSLLSNLM